GGLALVHVTAHNHCHPPQSVLVLVLRLASKWGGASFRPPYEPLALGRIGASPPALRERLAARSLAPWLSFLRRRVLRAGLRHNDTLLGLRASGHLNESLLLDLLGQLPAGITELYFHPSIRRTPQLAAMMPGYDNEAEFAALTSSLVSERLHALGLKPVGFADLQ